MFAILIIIKRIIISSKTWQTEPIPFRRGVFQGDTLSPVIFLLAFNPLLKLAESVNHPYGYRFKLPIEGSETLPPLDSYIYAKWSEPGEELPGWYRAHIEEYFLDKSCKVVYDDRDGILVSEIVSLHQIEWKLCSKRAQKFVPFDGHPVFTKSNWKPSLKFANSMEHSLKGYADDVTLLSIDIDVHMSVLKSLDLRAADLDLCFKPSKWYLFCLIVLRSYHKEYPCLRNQRGL